MKKYINYVYSFLRDNKNYILLSFFFLFLSLVILYFLDIDESLKNLLLQQAAETVKKVYSMHNYELAWNIFLNNALVGFFVLLSGFAMSLFAILVVFGNAALLRVITPLSVEKVGLWKTILALISHGFTEVFAILLSVVLAFKITHLLIKKVNNWKETKIWPSIEEIFKFRFVFVVPLLFLSALIETFITPLFLK